MPVGGDDLDGVGDSVSAVAFVGSGGGDMFPRPPAAGVAHFPVVLLDREQVGAVLGEDLPGDPDAQDE